jgi:hypothetical protein
MAIAEGVITGTRPAKLDFFRNERGPTVKHYKRRTLLTAVTTLALAGCGGGVIAPEGAQSNAFLDKVSASCGKLSVGNQPINYLLDVNSDDT